MECYKQVPELFAISDSVGNASGYSFLQPDPATDRASHAQAQSCPYSGPTISPYTNTDSLWWGLCHTRPVAAQLPTWSRLNRTIGI
jgi:hypothetical protein